MKLYKKGFFLLLCGVSTLITGCGYSSKISSLPGTSEYRCYLSSRFEMKQKHIVEFDLEYGFASDFAYEDWRNRVAQFDIDYFGLYLTISGVSGGITTFEDKMIAKASVSDKSLNWTIENRLESACNDGKAISVGYVEENLTLLAESFDVQTKEGQFTLYVSSLDAYGNKVSTERYYNIVATSYGITGNFTYDENEVTFIRKTFKTYIHCEEAKHNFSV